MGNGGPGDQLVAVLFDQLEKGFEVEKFFIAGHGDMGFEWAVFFGDAGFCQGIFDAVEHFFQFVVFLQAHPEDIEVRSPAEFSTAGDV